jgi:ATP sulfurylase
MKVCFDTKYVIERNRNVNDLKNYVINECVDLHVALHHGTSYNSTENGAYSKLKDFIRYEELKAVVRNNPDWDNEEISREISEGVRKRTTIW